jgi:hypothetical protein
MLPYTIVTLTLLAGLFVFKPWQKSQQTDVMLAEQMRVEPDMFAPEPAPATAPALTTPPAPGPAASNPVETAPPPKSSTVTAAAKTAEISEDAKTGAPGITRGFIMRGEIEVSDFANTWPMIRDKIIALGGKVAGNVELGWLRRPDQSYFHFSAPESTLPELELFLGTFGPVRFSKEKHPRLMPEGQIRIILTVKDSITNESPPDTP